MLDKAPVQWLFEQHVFDDGNPERMIGIVRQRGMQCAAATFVSVEGNDNDLRPLKPLAFPDDRPVFVYGSMNLMRSLLGRRKWPQLAWYDFPRFRCQSYYAHWGEFLLQQDYAFIPLAEVRRRHDWLYQTFGRDGTIFVRPDDNAKSFSGGIVREDDFQRWWELANFYDPGPDCLTVVARPQTIRAEWRLVIGQRAVVTGSQYRCDGAEEIAASYPAEASAFAEQVAKSTSFDPHPVYVMDVCQTDGGYRIVEIGSVCCASLYACDIERVVDAVLSAAQQIDAA